MEVIALVPMKGHSERVPNKNMKPFCSEPLYRSIIKTLQESELVSTIVINTDSELIAEDATRHFSKVQIVWRPENLQGDFVSMNDILRYDIGQYPDNEYFIQTHATNPLLKVKTVTKAINTFGEVIDKGYDSLFGVTKYQSRFFWQNGNPINHDPEVLIRTQDLPPIFEENSNLYLFSRQSFFEAGNKRIGRRPAMFEINKLEAIDIDDNDDFILAESLCSLFRKA
jgi:CMP-N-acetylneuraminic acid synthetase